MQAGATPTPINDVPSTLRLVLRAVDGLGSGLPDVEFQTGQSDTLRVVHGTQYSVTIRTLDEDDVDITFQRFENFENVQVFFAPSNGATFSVEASDKESDYGNNDFGNDLEVGLTANLVSNEGSLGGMHTLLISVVEYPGETKNGSTTNGAESEFDFSVPVSIDRAPGPVSLGVPITTASIEIEPGPGQSDTTRHILTVSNPAGLASGGVTSDSLILQSNTEYFGVVKFFNDAVPIELTEAMWEDRNYYQVVYNIFLLGSPIAELTLNPDDNGLPFGFLFTFSVSAGARANGESFVRVYQFDPNRGESKSDVPINGTVVAEFTVPFRYD